MAGNEDLLEALREKFDVENEKLPNLLAKEEEIDIRLNHAEIELKTHSKELDDILQQELKKADEELKEHDDEVLYSEDESLRKESIDNMIKLLVKLISYYKEIIEKEKDHKEQLNTEKKKQLKLIEIARSELDHWQQTYDAAEEANSRRAEEANSRRAEKELLALLDAEKNSKANNPKKGHGPRGGKSNKKNKTKSKRTTKRRRKR